MTTQERPLPTNGEYVNFIGTAVVQDGPHSDSPDRVPPLGGPRETSVNGVTDEYNSKMQVCWNEAMCKEMNIPEGYQNVAVLIIKWTKDIDQLKSGDEVEELDKLFRQDFNYPTQIVELTNTSKPQLQLNLAVMNFVSTYNGPHNLLIVYYTGHGSFHETSDLLELHASDTPADTLEGNYRASAVWNYAERTMIEDADCDMVAILDTCFASNLYKNIQRDDPRTYELLTASGHDRTTVGPASKDRPFTIRQVCDKINLHRARRKNQSHVWSRFKRYDRNIALAPLKRTPAERQEDFNFGQTRASLSLRLSLTVERLNEQQIITTARALSKAVKKTEMPVQRIDWWGLRSSGRINRFANLGRTVGSVVKWKNKTFSKRQVQPTTTIQDRTVQSANDVCTQTVDDPNTVESVLVESGSKSTLPHMTHKRKHSGGHNDASKPQSKRRFSKESSEHGQQPWPSPNPLTPLSGPEPDTT